MSNTKRHKTKFQYMLESIGKGLKHRARSYQKSDNILRSVFNNKVSKRHSHKKQRTNDRQVINTELNMI